jgi:predicted nucleotidyltransferase
MKGGCYMKNNYLKLAENYLRLARKISEELQANKEVVGVAVIGSTARGDVHRLSDIDLVVLVQGSGIFQWKRRVVQDIVVNVAIRSIDVLKKMAKENSDTIFALREALILYDPKNILRSIKKDATLTEPIRKELVGDLLDEARSFIGKAERALTEERLESTILCLRHGVIKLAELMIFEYTGNKANPMNLWEEINKASLPRPFKELFADIQSFKAIEKRWLMAVLEELKTFLPEPAK